MKFAKIVTIGLSALAISLALPARANTPTFHRISSPHKLQFNMAIGHPKSYALVLVTRQQWSRSEYGCLVQLWQHESNWNYKSKNHSSTAFGIGQLLHEKSHNPKVQIENGFSYIIARYSTPCKAWRFWKFHYWY